MRASLLVNEYKNSGPQNLAREIMPALQSGLPFVIILDEIHALTENYKKEQNADPGASEALWGIIDECAKYPQILFIGTTNDATRLPEPLKTRFANSIIEIPLPNLEQRKNIIRFYLRNVPHALDDAYITSLAKRTDKLAGRNIEQCVADAVTFALDRDEMPIVYKTDIKRALREMKTNQNSLGLFGWRKYAQLAKENTIGLAALGSIVGITTGLVGLTFQYWSMQKQNALQRTAHLETKNQNVDFHKAQLDQQKKLSDEAQAETIKREKENFEKSQKLQKDQADALFNLQKKNGDKSFALAEEGAGWVLMLGSVTASVACPILIPLGIIGLLLAWKWPLKVKKKAEKHNREHSWLLYSVTSLFSASRILSACTRFSHYFDNWV